MRNDIQEFNAINRHSTTRQRSNGNGESLESLDEMIRFHLRKMGISLAYLTKEGVISAFREGIKAHRAA